MYNLGMAGIAEIIAVEHARSTKDQADALGFDASGIASAGEAIDPENRLGAWLERGYHADMAWMARNAATRRDAQVKLPAARSVVVVARNYYAERPQADAGSGKVSRYAWGRDYHKVLRKPLIELARHIESLEPGAQTYASVDTGPVLERAWAQRAGVGAIGKHSLALRRDMGSWFFLGTILTTVELEPDAPAEDICGTCRLCIDACPTSAIVEARVVDSKRCISYQTIENRGEIPQDLHAEHGDWVYGCDVCQEVCPWNRFAATTTEEDFLPRAGHANPDLEALLGLDEKSFDAEFAGTTIRRAKYAGMMRNAAIAKANQTQP
ncbi:MAG: tRNA epoxyqueuosine(34) reductase QueG [Candidatus Hydrogenedentes bacterium]|nr:tRNA epoxyqueuosine(34) reductase QueG [Candidatus Hydrogenedentota bacterium]MDK1020683.1 tRNA epoxyqueuosine(34) reductase QueG [Candidatus Hydrogenedentota bacterium]